MVIVLQHASLFSFVKFDLELVVQIVLLIKYTPYIAFILCFVMSANTLSLYTFQCKLCGRDGTIQMVPKYGEPLTLDASQKEALAKLMVFECRGFEPIDFIFGDGWVAESVSASLLIKGHFLPRG